MHNVFHFYTGELIKTLKLPYNKNHFVFKWLGNNTLFSVTEQGNAVSIHIATDEPFSLRKSIPLFCKFLFNNYKYQAILAKIINEKMGEIIKRYGFKRLSQVQDVVVYIKRR